MPPDSRDLLQWLPTWHHPCCRTGIDFTPELRCDLCHREQLPGRHSCSSCSASVPLTRATDPIVYFKVDTQKIKEAGKEVSVRACQVVSVVSDSLWSGGLEPTRLLNPRDSPGKNIGVGCSVLLQGIFLTQGSNLHLLHLLN